MAKKSRPKKSSAEQDSTESVSTADMVRRALADLKAPEGVKASLKAMLKTDRNGSLLQVCRATSADIHEINGGVRGRIADAVENHGMHKKAFSTIRALDKMTPEKLADYLDHLFWYLEVSGLMKRAASAQRLPIGEGVGEGGEEDEGEESPAQEAGGGGVAQFPAAARPH